MNAPRHKIPIRVPAPVAVAFIAVVAISFFLLTAAFRSVVIATKAAVLNLLSIGAAYGVIVAIFEWGWGKDVIGLQSTLPIPAYLTCQATCTTVEYKSLTRKHIESLGYRIVANVGDQFSDLQGGHEQRAFKLPNPMYFIA